MAKTLAVFGATGTQGSSVVNNVLADPEISKQYKLRAITRDTSSEKANALKRKGVEVVPGDVADHASIEKALAGANFVFIMSTPSFGPGAVDAEFANTKSVADIAVAKGLEYIIFSTLPSCSEISGGKYTAITAFDAKAKTEAYIKTLPIKSAFWCGAFFMENWVTQPFLAPQPNGDGTYSFVRNLPATQKMPYIDATGDTGKFVNAILAEPEKYNGETLYAAAGWYTMDEIAAVLGKSAGKTVTYKELSDEDFKKSLPFMGDLFTEGGGFGREYGYFGPGGEEKVARSQKAARGKLTSFQEYFEKHHYTLA